MARSISRSGVRRAATLLCSFLLASEASAADGRLEISQACAQSGCFAGDAPGFPVTIVARGSYLLTSDLASPDTAHAIVVAAPFVTLDLNGFSVAGPRLFGACGPPFDFDGISGPGQVGATVRNGRVLGMRRTGVSLGAGARVEDVSVEQNCWLGVEVGATSVVARTRAILNRLTGIDTGERSLVVHAVADQNGNEGINVGADSIVESSIATGTIGSFPTTGHGIFAGPGTVVRGAAVSQNQGYGVRGAPGVLLLQSTVNANQSAALGDPTMAFGLNVLYGNTTLNATGILVACDANAGVKVCP